MTPNGYVTDGRTDGRSAGVRPSADADLLFARLLSPFARELCARPLLLHCCLALLLCFFSHRRVAFLLSQSGFLRLGLKTFLTFPLDGVNLLGCFFS
jgi:hypothetical protein